MEEIWKTIEDYPNYMVSNMGRVKRLSTGYYRRTEKILIPQLQSNGYLHIKLSQNGKSKCFLLHRLVAMVFVPNPDNLPQVNHINENKTDNRVENLEWCDRKYNINYGNSLMKRVRTNIENGVYEKLAILNSKKFSKPILQFSLDGKLIKKWNSIKEIEKKLGFSYKQICNCLKQRQKTAKGFVWKYYYKGIWLKNHIPQIKKFAQ